MKQGPTLISHGSVLRGNSDGQSKEGRGGKVILKMLRYSLGSHFFRNEIRIKKEIIESKN